MIVGFVSDSHGNSQGLDRCLRALRKQGADSIYFLGDSVGYLPEENAVLRLLASSKATCIRGNHEEMVLGNLPLPASKDKVYRLMDARERLLPRWRAWIREWPIRCEPVFGGSRLLIVHGSPADPIGGYVYADSDLMSFRDLPYDAVLMGQTHVPFIATSGTVSVINVGSSGMPRDVGNLASCAVYDTVLRRFEILRVEFDAAGIVATLGDRIDASVAACLQRTAAGGRGQTIGRIVSV